MVFPPDPPPPNLHAGGFSFGSNRLMFGNEIFVEITLCGMAVHFVLTRGDLQRRE
jgi:hypothetical protein